MKLLICCIVLTVNAWGQNWIKIPGTDILYSDLLKKDSSNFNAYQFEYFKQGSRVIAVEHSWANNFLKLFRKNTVAFHDMYNASPRIQEKISWLEQNSFYKNSLATDTIVINMSFEQIMFITDCRFIKGYREYLWIMEIGSGDHINLEPCYMNVVYKISKRKRRAFKYLATVKGYCEI